MENEIWVPITGYEGYYEVSNLGRVKALSRIVKRGCISQPVRERILSAGGDAHHYPCVQLFKNGKGKRCKVHRLVAEAFIPNPSNAREVDHINTMRNDNRVENLRWVTHKENMCNKNTRKYMSEFVDNNPKVKEKILKTKIKNKTRTSPKRIFQYSTEGQFIKEWTCAAEVEASTGFKRKSIAHYARNKSFGFGYLWANEKTKMQKHTPYAVQNKKIIQMDLNGSIIKEWESIKSAEESLGIQSISSVLHGKRISAGGYKWKFA